MLNVTPQFSCTAIRWASCSVFVMWPAPISSGSQILVILFSFHMFADSFCYESCDVFFIGAEGQEVFDHVHVLFDTWAVDDFKGYGSAASAGRGGEAAGVWLAGFRHLCPVSLPTERGRR